MQLNINIKFNLKINVNRILVKIFACSLVIVSGGIALAANPGGNDSIEPALSSARELIEHKQFDQAISILSGLLGRHPDALEAYALRGCCYNRMEDFERSIRDFKIYFKTAKEPVNVKYHRLYGLSLMQSHNFPEALKQFDIDIKMSPKTWDFWFDRSELYFLDKKYDKALADADVMVKLKPDSYRYALRAKIEYAKGDYQKAVDDYSAALKKDPDRSDYFEERAKCYDKLGKSALAAQDRKKRDDF